MGKLSSTPPPVTEETKARAEHLRSEMRRCHAAIEGGDSDPWWREDLDRFERELRLLEKGDAARSNQEATPENPLIDPDLDRKRASHRLAMLSIHPDGAFVCIDAEVREALNYALSLTAKPVQEATRTVGDAELRDMLRDVQACFWVGRPGLRGVQEYVTRTWEKVRAFNAALTTKGDDDGEPRSAT